MNIFIIIFSGSFILFFECFFFIFIIIGSGFVFVIFRSVIFWNGFYRYWWIIIKWIWFNIVIFYNFFYKKYFKLAVYYIVRLNYFFELSIILYFSVNIEEFVGSIVSGFFLFIDIVRWILIDTGKYLNRRRIVVFFVIFF